MKNNSYNIRICCPQSHTCRGKTLLATSAQVLVGGPRGSGLWHCLWPIFERNLGHVRQADLRGSCARASVKGQCCHFESRQQADRSVFFQQFCGEL